MDFDQVPIYPEVDRVFILNFHLLHEVDFCFATKCLDCHLWTFNMLSAIDQIDFAFGKWGREWSGHWSPIGEGVIHAARERASIAT